MSAQVHMLQLRYFLSWLIFFGYVGMGSGYARSTTKKHKPCGDYQTQYEMNQCAAEEAKAADDALNTTYREFLAKLKGSETATTRAIAAEKTWIAFRDAELASDWPVANGENPSAKYGSVHPFCYFKELAALTWERIRVLRGRMKREEEGDVCSIQVATRLKNLPHQGCSSAASKAQERPTAVERGCDEEPSRRGSDWFEPVMIWRNVLISRMQRSIA